MPDEKKPGEAQPEEQPFFQVKDGKMQLFGGEFDLNDIAGGYLDVKEVETGIEDIPAEEEPDEEEKEERVQEVEEAEPEPEEEEAEEEEAQEEPEEKEPDKFKFTVEVRGEKREVELTREQIANRLQLLRQRQEDEREFYSQKKRLSAFEKIAESDAFKDWIKERKEAGEEIPQEPVKSFDQEALEYEIAKRRDPQVLAQLQEWALDTLTREQIEILDTNPTVFMKEYDSIASQIKAKAEVKPEPKKEPVDKKVKEKILKSKEVEKQRAAVEKPQASRTEPPADVARKKRIKHLERVMKHGNKGQSEDAALEYARMMYFPND